MGKTEKSSQAHLRPPIAQFCMFGLWDYRSPALRTEPGRNYAGASSSENAEFCNEELYNEAVKNWIPSTQTNKLWVKNSWTSACYFSYSTEKGIQRTVEVIINEKQQALLNG